MLPPSLSGWADVGAPGRSEYTLIIFVEPNALSAHLFSKIGDRSCPAPRGCVADFGKPRWSPPAGFSFCAIRGGMGRSPEDPFAADIRLADDAARRQGCSTKGVRAQLAGIATH